MPTCSSVRGVFPDVFECAQQYPIAAHRRDVVSNILAAHQRRSIPKQIEYWSKIGKIAEENPDLTYALIRDILIADQEETVGEYAFN